MSNLTKLYHEGRNGWYVDTPMGREGPLTLKAEADRYLALIDAVCAARGENSWTRRFTESRPMLFEDNEEAAEELDA